jgi:hypothetical protein
VAVDSRRVAGQQLRDEALTVGWYLDAEPSMHDNPLAAQAEHYKVAEPLRVVTKEVRHDAEQFGVAGSSSRSRWLSELDEVITILHTGQT